MNERFHADCSALAQQPFLVSSAFPPLVSFQQLNQLLLPCCCACRLERCGCMQGHMSEAHLSKKLLVWRGPECCIP